ncbi:hypothetical protein GCM10022406_25400 [Hymenobacter algoricola]|uniref:DUF2939 domain-containing protein n=1 Tax=Hymenobacter algoricola TaxID=486267 RepID=A0ABP7N9I2_9BACT
MTRLYAYRSLVLVLLLGIAGGLIYYLYDLNRVTQAEKQSIITLYAAQPVTRSVDAQGRETVRVVTPTISAAVLKQVKAGLAAEVRDQLRKEFGRNAQLLQAQRVQTQTGQVLPTVALRDTTVHRATAAGIVAKPARAGTFKDPWLSLTGIVTDDSLSVKYSIRNEFDVRAYSMRDAKHWWQFWKPRKVFVDLKNKNPNTTTTALEAVAVEKK